LFSNSLFGSQGLEEKRQKYDDRVDADDVEREPRQETNTKGPANISEAESKRSEWIQRKRRESNQMRSNNGKKEARETMKKRRIKNFFLKNARVRRARDSIVISWRTRISISRIKNFFKIHSIICHVFTHMNQNMYPTES